jgi:hypothetical protein
MFLRNVGIKLEYYTLNPAQYNPAAQPTRRRIAHFKIVVEVR